MKQFDTKKSKVKENILKYLPKDQTIHYLSYKTSEEGITEKQVIGRLFLREFSDYIFEKMWDHSGRMIDEDPPINDIVKSLKSYQITDIWYEDNNKVYVKLVSPGILIGEKGKHLEEIEEMWKTFAEKVNIPFKGIKIVEDKSPLDDCLLYAVRRYDRGILY